MRHLAHFLGTKRPVKLVTLIFIIFIVILVIFSLPSSGGSWCKAVTPGCTENPRGLVLASAKSMAKCWPLGVNDSAGQGLAQTWEKKHNSSLPFPEMKPLASSGFVAR